VSRPRLALALTCAALACLVLAASAVAKPRSAKPHKAGATSDLLVQAPKASNLTVGQAVRMKVKVSDRGHAAIAGVALLAKASKGVTVKPAKVKVGRLTPGKKKVATFQVTATSTAKPRLTFVATAPGEPKASDGVALKVAAGEEAKKKPASAIVGRYFWRSELILSTTYLHGWYVVDEHWIYRGLPKGGLPTCTAQTAQGEEDGCLPYTWDEATGALNVAGTPGEFKPDTHTFKVGSDAYSEAAPAEAGARFDATGSYINGFGLCPSFCSFTTIELSMSANGEFARAAGISGFFGEGGSYTALPPEDHGTYSIDQRGRITFHYADGHALTETIALMTDDADNPDPNYGILLDERDFFGPHSGV
jgi:hypothetical protein